MSESNFDEFVGITLKVGDEVRDHFRNWVEGQDLKIKRNIGFFMFPELVSLGCTIIKETAVFTNNEKIKDLLMTFEKWEEQIISGVAEMVIENEIRFNLHDFDSQAEIQLFFDAVGEDLKFDFFEWFGPVGEKFFNEFEQDFRKVICLMFSCGFAAISEGFSYLMESSEDYPEFEQELKNFHMNFLMNCTQVCSELKQSFLKVNDDN